MSTTKLEDFKEYEQPFHENLLLNTNSHQSNTNEELTLINSHENLLLNTNSHQSNTNQELTLINSHECQINVTKPASYSNQPLNWLIPNRCRQPSKDEIADYLETINNQRIMIVNGIKLCVGEYIWSNVFFCNECNDKCNGELLSHYNYCYECQINLCDSCFNQETNNHNEHYVSHRQKPYLFFCDLCMANGGDELFLNDHAILSTTKYHNDEYDYDLCLKCSQTNQGQLIIVEKKLDLIDNITPWSQCQFNSLMDWIPIIIESEEGMILINLNPESQYHEMFALASIDDHGRWGFYTIWKPTSIHELITEIQQLTDLKPNSSFIKRMMKKRNMITHYG